MRRAGATWSDIAVAATQLRPSRNKFNATVVELDGHRFASKAEARRYSELSALAKRGEISDLWVHPKYVLTVNGVKIGHYTGDFGFTQYEHPRGDITVCEDVKSVATKRGEAYRLRVKLASALYPKVTFREEIR